MKITYCKYLKFNLDTNRYECPYKKYKDELNEKLIFNEMSLAREKLPCSYDAFKDKYGNFICWEIEEDNNNIK